MFDAIHNFFGIQMFLILMGTGNYNLISSTSEYIIMLASLLLIKNKMRE